MTATQDVSLSDPTGAYAAAAAPSPVDAYADASEPIARNTIPEERQLLAALLAYPASAAEDVLDLPAEHFTGSRHQELWKVLTERAHAGLDADVPAVVERFYDQPGMETFINNLAADGISPRVPAQLPTLAEVVTKGHRARLFERSLLRGFQLLKAGQIDAAYAAMATVDPTVGQIDRSVTLTQAWAEARAEAEAGIRVIPTPWPTLNNDYLSGGWRARELYFLSGAPGGGKTASMQVIADHAAKNEYHVSVYSLEMARQDFARRTLSTAGKVSMSEMMRPALDLTADAHAKTDQAIAEIGEHVHITDDYLTINQLRDQARIDVRRHNVSLILVDYAQLVAAEDKRLNERERIELVVEELKVMAKELAVPVVALVQPNRNAALQGRKLGMTDLHGSGALEKFAALILLLNPVLDEDEQGNPVPTPFVDFDIPKNRYGKCGTIRMVADLGRQMFEEL